MMLLIFFNLFICILQTRPIFELFKPYKSHFEGIQI